MIIPSVAALSKWGTSPDRAFDRLRLGEIGEGYIGTGSWVSLKNRTTIRRGQRWRTCCATHCGHERWVDGDPRRITGGERSETDAAISGVAFKRFTGPGSRTFARGEPPPFAPGNLMVGLCQCPLDCLGEHGARACHCRGPCEIRRPPPAVSLALSGQGRAGSKPSRSRSRAGSPRGAQRPPLPASPVPRRPGRGCSGPPRDWARAGSPCGIRGPPPLASPWPARARPRLLWAGARSGLIRIAARYSATASSGFPC